MDKYLVFALNKWVVGDEPIVENPVYPEGLVQFPCFELVKEFEIKFLTRSEDYLVSLES